MTTVLFEAWRGRYADSPRALSEYLREYKPNVRLHWVKASNDHFPQGVHLVRRHSPGYFWRLVTSDYLVTNDIVSRHYADGARVAHVQCWHGTPLKAIGFDDNRNAYPGAKAHWKRTLRDLATWDYLISPSPMITPIFRSAFAYDGPVLEIGSPRNDLLFHDRDGRIRAQMRKDLEIPNGALLVLYAPTWRDDDADQRGRFALSVAPDWEKLAHALPDAYVLFRTHKNVVAEAPKLPNIIDASGVPDIAELYLAADVLVSDYSSAIFDFAVTGKPIISYAPDLEHYRNDLRALYFEYETWLPGPITVTTDDLIGALRELQAVQAAYAERYTTFVRTFCPYDDGHASERLVNSLPFA